jgi:hypothetical protein
MWCESIPDRSADLFDRREESPIERDLQSNDNDQQTARQPYRSCQVWNGADGCAADCRNSDAEKCIA